MAFLVDYENGGTSDMKVVKAKSAYEAAAKVMKMFPDGECEILGIEYGPAIY